MVTYFAILMMKYLRLMKLKNVKKSSEFTTIAKKKPVACKCQRVIIVDVMVTLSNMEIITMVI